jgi:hypothetical protein
MRLITFGCSLTYGHGLQDCWDNDTQSPGGYCSKLAWPSKLAKDLGVKCINTSFPGASAKETLFKIQNFNFLSDDIAVVLWTYPQRSCNINVDSIDSTNKEADSVAFTRYVPGGEDGVKIKTFYSLYNETDSMIDYYTRIEYANLYFNSVGIRAFHFIPEQRYLKNFSWLTATIQPVYFGQIKTQFPLALDDLHPGKLAHYKFAEDIFKIINNTSVVDS